MLTNILYVMSAFSKVQIMVQVNLRKDNIIQTDKTRQGRNTSVECSIVEDPYCWINTCR